MADTQNPATTTTPSEAENDDSDYRPETESEIDDMNAQAYLEGLAALSPDSQGDAEDMDDDEDEEGEEGDGEDDDDEEPDEHAHYIEVEIEEGGQDATETEVERSELYRIPYILLFLVPFIDIIMLILGMAAARQRRQVMRILAHSQLGRLFFHADQGVEDDEDDEDFNPIFRRRRRRPKPDPNRFPKVPSDEGTRLMESGTFGTSDIQDSTTDLRTSSGSRKRLTSRIFERELATESYNRQKMNQRLMAQDMIPSTTADMIIHYNQPVYSGQFSDDGNFFYSVNKDFRVRMYDTSNPYQWRYYKTVEYIGGQWTLTDASLSRDNKYLAYTSIRSTVCLAPTDPNDKGDPYNLDLSDRGTGRTNNNFMYRSRSGSFGIWSIRFSGDGRQLVAGATAGSIVVYDIESRRTLHRIFGHDGDVNAVCFADSSSPHILYSGSDDTTLKVWDTRSMGDSRAAGAFVGHIEGLTYIDSKMDGRYILSNGKDQSMKLWDLRMVMSDSDFNDLPPVRQDSRFDYRWGPYDEDSWYVHPNDNSLVTYRGHKVLRTLIRCHFSPPGSTNSRYVYSGSADGKVYIWNMDGTIAGKVDVYAATVNSRAYHSEFGMDGWGDDDEFTQNSWRTCVRDASWHPNAPIIAASALNGYGSATGTCTVHSWNDGAEEDEGEPRMGYSVNQRLEMEPF
ncbi:hypothetical protein HYALB_00000060 [Hymenoscyphus albidus]|uniref:WD40 repeat-like protein n=1 Tax=Hymenoscyphus albidus TaxID=595503 RepID=A0A9N9LFX0_9HELO|nr:hypothetical protein HYALB_00000060 [Hymenoscyphus albidus]